MSVSAPSRTGGKVLTIGGVAKLARVAPRTASRWFDTGEFPGGYRVGRDRRVPIEDVRAFLTSRNMPLDLLPMTSIYAVGLSPAEAGEVGALSVANGFDLGRMSQVSPPYLVIVDAGAISRPAAMGLVSAMRASYPQTKRVAVAAEDDSDHDGLLAAGFHRVVGRPFGAGTLARIAAEMSL